MAETMTKRKTSSNPRLSEILCESLRNAAACIPGDQVAPCAILWTDPERQWAAILEDMKSILPELFVLGPYEPDKRMGPAIWLRCIEGRSIDTGLSAEQTPIFYLPGVSKQQLRAIEECPTELHPLAEMQFRGTVWAHPNGRDWTPFALLSSDHGGMGLEVAKDTATLEALSRALPNLLKEPIAGLHGQRLDAEFFNYLLAPDFPREILLWMNDPDEAKKRKSPNEWHAFCDQCKTEYRFHPEKDGELQAATILGNQEGKWGDVWRRFVEAPARYGGIADLLERASPASEGRLDFHPDSWPSVNSRSEADLLSALQDLKNAPPDKAVSQVLELEKKHGVRRSWVWSEMGKAPLAVALEHLSLLATLVQRPLAAPSSEEFGELYTQSGWEVDLAALKALATSGSHEESEAICAAVRSIYLPWLDESARNLQNLCKSKPTSIHPRLDPIEAQDGRAIIFVDGLRMDVGRRLAKMLADGDLNVNLSWDWAPFPSVTSTAKPYVSPIRKLLGAGDASEDFSLTIAENGKTLTHDRFLALLAECSVGVLANHNDEISFHCGWLEAGSLDKRGHSNGKGLARFIDEEIGALIFQIRAMLARGWKEIIVVTDHGWLLMPGGLPKVELPSFLADHKWGRCAAIKSSSTVNLPILPWFWNSAVNVAYPPAIGCFRAGTEYAHGGLSAQEMIVPRLTVSPGKGISIEAKISSVKWIGLRCRVTISTVATGLRVDIRSRLADSTSSKVEGAKPREIGPDGTVSLPMADDRDQGAAAVVVLLSPDERALHSAPTIIGENS